MLIILNGKDRKMLKIQINEKFIDIEFRIYLMINNIISNRNNINL